MITENLSTLKIHKLTQEQYDREFAAGNINENEVYLTPDEEIDLSPYATVEQLDEKADKMLQVVVSQNDGVYTANYKASEIIEHISNGGDTLLVYNEIFILPLMCAIDGSVMYHKVIYIPSLSSFPIGLTVTVHEDSVEVSEEFYNPLSQGFIKEETVSSTYETKTDASAKLEEAKSYTDTVADEKADASHTHAISDITNLQNALDGKADISHSHNDIYYTKTEIDNMEFVTVDDIDTICGTTIQVATASEVTF